MSKNTAIKVKYLAYDQAHEEVFPMDFTIVDLSNYLRCVCNTYVITDIYPTTKEVNFKVKED